jgi:uncharacterized protein (TIGR02266 family)
MGDDRRQDPRAPADNLKARVRFADAKKFEQCYLKDISRGGIFLRTAAPSPLGTSIEVTLVLPDTSEVVLPGKVVHRVGPESAAAGQVSGIGVKFEELKPAVRNVLEAVLKDLPGRTVPAAAAPPPPPAPPRVVAAPPPRVVAAPPPPAAPPPLPPAPPPAAAALPPPAMNVPPAVVIPAAPPAPAVNVPPALVITADLPPRAAPPVLEITADLPPEDPPPRAAMPPPAVVIPAAAPPAVMVPPAIIADDDDGEAATFKRARPEIVKISERAPEPLRTTPSPVSRSASDSPLPESLMAEAPAQRSERPPARTGAQAEAARGAAGTRAGSEVVRRLLWRFADVTKLAGRSYYDILGLAPGASLVEVQASCEALRRGFDLERPPSGLSREVMDRVIAVVGLIDEIEACLGNAERRRDYDRELGIG